MKTLEQIIKSRPVYLHDWSESKRKGVLQDFSDYDSNYDKKEKAFDSTAKILFATYTYANYSGDAFVLFEQNGKLYEVNGSHCSCYGLEGQWKPEEVNLKELYNRVTGGSFGVGYYGEEDEFEFKNELAKFLGIKPAEITYKENE